MNRVINPKKLMVSIGIIEGVVFLIVTGAILINAKSDPTAWIGLIITLGVMAFSAGIVLYFMRPLLREQAIAEKGQPARGKLLRFWDTGTTINDNPLVGMELEVAPPGKTPYRAKTNTIIPRLSVGMLQLGAAVEVMYDPQDPQRVSFIDFSPLGQPALPESEPEEHPMAYGEYLQGRVAELEELHTRRMVTDGDYQRRKDELQRLTRTAGSAVVTPGQ